GRQPIDAPRDVAAIVAATDHIVDENAADAAARGFLDVEHLDAGLLRPQRSYIDRQPVHDRPAAVEDDKVECEAREFGRFWVGDDEIGAAIAALILETVELEPDRRRWFGGTRRRPTKQRRPDGNANV